MFMSAKRMDDIQMTYHRVTKLEYILEMENNFSINFRLQNERQEPTRYMPFTDGYGRSFGHYTLSSATLQLRYAPGEKFYQMKTGRVPINFDAPHIHTQPHMGSERPGRQSVCRGKHRGLVQQTLLVFGFRLHGRIHERRPRVDPFALPQSAHPQRQSVLLHTA